MGEITRATNGSPGWLPSAAERLLELDVEFGAGEHVGAVDSLDAHLAAGRSDATSRRAGRRDRRENDRREDAAS